MNIFLYAIRDNAIIDEVVLINHNPEEINEAAHELSEKLGNVKILKRENRLNIPIKQYVHYET